MYNKSNFLSLLLFLCRGQASSLLFLLLLSSCKSAHKKLPVQFFKENILFTVDTSEVQIEGKYYFKNRTKTNKIMKLFYPFPIDDNHLYPYYIEVEGTPFTKQDNGITFNVKVKALEVKEVVVRYGQKISTNNARYILTTAREWGESIEKASFVINIPQNLDPIISYKPDSVIIKEKRAFCYIEETNLFPTVDLVVSW